MLRPASATLYELLYTGLLDSSFQAYIGLMSQPESLNLHNKISLPLKSCQFPLESKPPQPTWDTLQWK